MKKIVWFQNKKKDTKLNQHLGEHINDLIEILDIKSGIDNGADGSKTEFYHDFVKNICGKTIVEKFYTISIKFILIICDVLT